MSITSKKKLKLNRSTWGRVCTWFWNMGWTSPPLPYFYISSGGCVYISASYVPDSPTIRELETGEQFLRCIMTFFDSAFIELLRHRSGQGRCVGYLPCHLVGSFMNRNKIKIIGLVSAPPYNRRTIPYSAYIVPTSSLASTYAYT